MKTAAGILQWCDEFQPFLCRMVARKNHGRHAMTNQEIAKAAGVSKGTVAKLSTRLSWAGVSVDVMNQFMAACGVTLENISAHRKFLRRHSAHRYMQDADPKQKKMFNRLKDLY